MGRLTQTRGPLVEVPGNAAAAAAVSLTDAALIQRVGGEQHAVAPDWLSGRKQEVAKQEVEDEIIYENKHRL